MTEFIDNAVRPYFNFWIYVILMMIGLWAVIAKKNFIKKLLGLAIFQSAIILFYVSIGVMPPSIPGRWWGGHERAETWSGITPMGRVGNVRDIANAVVYAASDAADFVTGQTLYVDGGLWTKAQWPYEVEWVSFTIQPSRKARKGPTIRERDTSSSLPE